MNRRCFILAIIFMLLFSTPSLAVVTVTEGSLFQKAEQGDAEAQFDLGVIYYEGEGVPQDFEESIKWLTRAAGQEYADAQNFLGLIYGDTSSILYSEEKAVKWFAKAANQGHANGQYFLGMCFGFGKGVTQDQAEAVRWYIKAAEQGLANAQYYLGLSYDFGEGVDQDHKKAVKWYIKAAEQGIAGAQYELGQNYNIGLGIDQDYSEAVRWYSKAAEQGLADAQYELGRNYDFGLGVAQDHIEAVRWYTKAAEQGFAPAQHYLGLSYALGEGVSKDHRKAVEWYIRAAQQGYADAQFSLGLNYVHGEGVAEDYVQAYKWINLAASQRLEVAIEIREILLEKLSHEQVIEAQRLSREFRPNQNEPDLQEERFSVPSYKSTGTGFFITTDGYLITAHHVVEDASRIQIWTAQGPHWAQLVHADIANDIALLKADVEMVNVLPVGLSRKVRTGQEIFILGFPNIDLQGREAKYTHGHISSLSGIGGDTRLFQISAAVQPGNSGGPLLDDKGQVIGVVVAMLDEFIAAAETGSIPQNVNYALKSSYVLSFLEVLPQIRGNILEQRDMDVTRTELVEQTSKALVLILCY